jgi:hypothetical protein
MTKDKDEPRATDSKKSVDQTGPTGPSKAERRSAEPAEPERRSVTADPPAIEVTGYQGPMEPVAGSTGPYIWPDDYALADES